MKKIEINDLILENRSRSDEFMKYINIVMKGVYLKNGTKIKIVEDGGIVLVNSTKGILSFYYDFIDAINNSVLDDEDVYKDFIETKIEKSKNINGYYENKVIREWFKFKGSHYENVDKIKNKKEKND